MDGLERDKAALSWFSLAWDDLLNNLPLVSAAALAQALISAFAFYLLHSWRSGVPAAAFLLLVATPVAVGANLFYVKLVRGAGAGLSDLFSAFPVYHRAVPVSVLLDSCAALLAVPALAALSYFSAGAPLLAMLAVPLLTVPAVSFYLAYAFSEYAVVDRRTGVRESFTLSSSITAGWKGRLFPLFTLFLLINVFAPDVFTVKGGLKNLEVSLDLRPWTVASSALKTLVFLPWLNLALARAYCLLLTAPPAPAAAPPEDA